jgi:hypothetical protein
MRRNRARPAHPLGIVAARVYPQVVLDPPSPVLISVDLAVGAPGRLRGRLLVHTQRVGQIDFAADVLAVADPGAIRLIAEVPGGLLGGGEHGVDVELWLDDRVGILRADAIRFRVDRDADGPSSCRRGAAAWTRGAAP